MAEVMQAPNYWDLLSLPDQEAYIHLQRQLSSNHFKHSKHSALQDLDNVFETIKTYTNKGNAEDWKRSSACGVYFINDCIAVNPAQLSILTDSSKTSINSQLERMKYVSIPSTSEAGKEIIKQIPNLSYKSSDSQWVVRKKFTMTPQPLIIDHKSKNISLFNTPQPNNPLQSPKVPSEPEFEEESFYDDPFMVPIKGWEESAQLHDSTNKLDSMANLI
ncbi:hypothetical protein TVAG_265380 [Trichomonas vaginalis G3]|uniref:Initiator binding domain-containing protein n=1 Tax=Trichomonas vaginalis (strain ATCC PRA-98 / G3) TaxID=412133 RepID=A2FGA3_TRIV3|nr:transcription-initiator DNA-binding domain ibd family [Trichomonas vaginalis G3]EAX96049.1 hypothetical protein TVAG_265380 [Trichomonas vaginalis G3]KAI5503993.1 transcription-initiator DNA-binding domain ibd family [Trichomonas vaginalis G3]|eukprot:XP_001308979.1 hypothetical protein [Trichomonas vaginalis G3]